MSLVTIDSKFLRFAVVGGVATVGYVALYAFFVSQFPSAHETLIAIIAYSLCAIYSYLAHKRFTFQNADAHSLTGPRFVLTTGLGLITAIAIAFLAGTMLGFSAVVVASLTAIAVPILNLVLLDKFVFAERT
ncbi:MAG: GtrA family protein [Pseudomonadota bacterium]